MKKWLIRMSVAVNLVVLVSLLGLYIAAPTLVDRYFLEPLQERWVSQFDVLPVQPGDIVFLGDSITEGGAWSELFPDLPVRNRGIAGDVTEGVLQRLGQVTDGKPAKVVLLIGTNDLFAGIAPSEIAGNISQIIDSIRVSSPGTGIYVQSVLPRAADYREKIVELNNLLENTISGKADWIDLYPLFLDSTDGSIRDDLSNDELHLLGQGYLVWRDAIDTQLRR